MTEVLKSITSASWSESDPNRDKGRRGNSSFVQRETPEQQMVWEEEIATGTEPWIETLEELHHHAFRLLSNTGDPHRLERTRRMLERYKGEDWRLWKQRFSSTSPSDTYGRSAVWGHTGCFQLLALTWTPGCCSPIHNHPCERCFLLPLQGHLAERRYHVCEETTEVTEFLYTRLQLRRAYWMDDSVGWHAVSNEGEDDAVSLHLYIPEISRCKIVHPRTSSIRWCICPSKERDTLPAASYRLFQILSASLLRASFYSRNSHDQRRRERKRRNEILLGVVRGGRGMLSSSLASCLTSASTPESGRICTSPPTLQKSASGLLLDVVCKTTASTWAEDEQEEERGDHNKHLSSSSSSSNSSFLPPSHEEDHDHSGSCILLSGSRGGGGVLSSSSSLLSSSSSSISSPSYSSSFSLLYHEEQLILLSFLLQAFRSDAEIELQQVRAGGESSLPNNTSHSSSSSSNTSSSNTTSNTTSSNTSSSNSSSSFSPITTALTSNVDIFSVLLHPFVGYSCASGASLPPAVCAAVLLLDLLLEANAPPLADGAVLQQITLLLHLAHLLFSHSMQRMMSRNSQGNKPSLVVVDAHPPAGNKEEEEEEKEARKSKEEGESKEARKSEEEEGELKGEEEANTLLKNMSPHMQAAMTSVMVSPISPHPWQPSVSSPNDHDVVHHSSQHQDPIGVVEGASRRSSMDSSRRQSTCGEDCVLRMQLQEVAMRTVEAYSINRTSSRVWDGWQEAPQLACVGRLFAAQMLLSESEWFPTSIGERRYMKESSREEGREEEEGAAVVVGNKVVNDAFQKKNIISPLPPPSCYSLITQDGHSSSGMHYDVNKTSICCCCFCSSCVDCQHCVMPVTSPWELVFSFIDSVMLLHIASFLGWTENREEHPLSLTTITTTLRGPEHLFERERINRRDFASSSYRRESLNRRASSCISPPVATVGQPTVQTPHRDERVSSSIQERNGRIQAKNNNNIVAAEEFLFSPRVDDEERKRGVVVPPLKDDSSTRAAQSSSRWGGGYGNISSTDQRRGSIGRRSITTGDSCKSMVVGMMKSSSSSLYYRHVDNRSRTSEAMLLKLLRQRASHGASTVPAAEDVAIQQAAADIFQCLLEDTGCFTPLREVVRSMLLLLLLDCRKEEEPVRSGGDRGGGKYDETHHEAKETPVADISNPFFSSPPLLFSSFSSSSLQRTLRKILEEFDHRQKTNRHITTGSVSTGVYLHSATRDNRRHSRTGVVAQEKGTTAAPSGGGEGFAGRVETEKEEMCQSRRIKSSGSMFSGLMGAVKKRLGFFGGVENDYHHSSTTPGTSFSSSAAQMREPVSSHKTLRPLRRRSFMAGQREMMEPQAVVVAGETERSTQAEDVWRTLRRRTSEGGGEKEEPQHTDKNIVAAASTPSTTEVERKKKHRHHDNGEVSDGHPRRCGDITGARTSSPDPFAGCWLPAKDDHLALIRIVVAALHAFFSQNTHQSHTTTTKPQTAADHHHTAADRHHTATDQQKGVAHQKAAAQEVAAGRRIIPGQQTLAAHQHTTTNWEIAADMQVAAETKQVAAKTKQMRAETKQVAAETKQVAAETKQVAAETKQVRGETKQGYLKIGKGGDDEGERGVLGFLQQQQDEPVKGRGQRQGGGEEETGKVERQYTVGDSPGDDGVMSLEEDSLCVYHFVAQHLDLTPYTFTVYCCEADVAQLAALRRAVQVFEGCEGENVTGSSGKDTLSTFITRKIQIELVRAASDGLMDLQDLEKRLVLWQQHYRDVAEKRQSRDCTTTATASDSISDIRARSDGTGRRRYHDKGKCEEEKSCHTEMYASSVQETFPRCPLLVCCSAGRAGGMRCGFDAFPELSQLCHQYNVWLHIDASNGAAILLPQEEPFRQYSAGISRADSVLWGFSPLLLGQSSTASPTGTSPGAGQKPSPAGASSALSTLSYGDCRPVAPTELVESVWDDTFPVALLSRHPAAFFISKRFYCSRSCGDGYFSSAKPNGQSGSPRHSTHTSNSTGSAPTTGNSRRDAALAAHSTTHTHNKGEGLGLGVTLSDTCTTWVGSPRQEGCRSLRGTSGSGDHTPGEIQQAGDKLYHAEEGSKRTLHYNEEQASSCSHALAQHPWNPVQSLDNAHTENEKKSGNPAIEKIRNDNVAKTHLKAEVAAQTLGAPTTKKVVKAVSCKERGIALAHLCGAGRKMVGLAFSIWCFWKKLGDVGVANRIRQVYLQCRRLEVFARNFPLRLKPAEYPTYVEGQERSKEAQQNTTRRRRMGRSIIEAISRSNSGTSEKDWSDDVAGDYDIDHRVTYDYEYARLHELSVHPLVADAALLLGLPEPDAMEPSGALRYACALFENGQNLENKKELGKTGIRAPTTEGATLVSPFLFPKEAGVTRRRTSPYTIAFRCSCPVDRLKYIRSPFTDSGAPTPTRHGSYHITAGKDLENNRLELYLKTLLDALEKREASIVAAPDAATPSATPEGHQQHSPFTTHKEGRTAGIPEEGPSAASESEGNVDSDSEDVASDSLSSAEDEEERHSPARDLPSFTLLTENFVVGIETTVPSQEAASKDLATSPADTLEPLCLAVSPIDPRMSEDEGYSLLCLINRLAELLWVASGNVEGSRGAQQSGASRI